MSDSADQTFIGRHSDCDLVRIEQLISQYPTGIHVFPVLQSLPRIFSSGETSDSSSCPDLSSCVTIALFGFLTFNVLFQVL